MNAIAQGSVLMRESSGNMVRLPKGKIGVLEGLEDFIIIDNAEVLLIMPKSREQEIKQWVAKVRDTYGEDFI